MGRFVSKNVLSLGCFVPWDVLSLETFCQWTLSLGTLCLWTTTSCLQLELELTSDLEGHGIFCVILLCKCLSSVYDGAIFLKFIKQKKFEKQAGRRRQERQEYHLPNIGTGAGLVDGGQLVPEPAHSHLDQRRTWLFSTDFKFQNDCTTKSRPSLPSNISNKKNQSKSLFVIFLNFFCCLSSLC